MLDSNSNPLAFGCFIVDFNYWDWFLKEKNYLLAFIKLSQKKVAIIQKGLKAFEKSLTNEEEFGDNQSMFCL